MNTIKLARIARAHGFYTTVQENVVKLSTTSSFDGWMPRLAKAPSEHLATIQLNGEHIGTIELHAGENASVRALRSKLKECGLTLFGIQIVA